jgi:glyoxylase-like metal-dependent hydrolase (beta-lactamase superfamily II)
VNRVELQLLTCGDCAHPALMTRRGGGLSPQRFPALVGVIRHPSEGLILFDTGYAPAFFEATAPFPERLYRWATPVRLEQGESAVERLARMGHAPKDVRAIVLSHFHGDHVAGLRDFPQARIFCARAGLSALRRHGRFARVRQGLLQGLVPDDLESRTRYFEDCPGMALPSSFSPFTLGADLLGDGALLAVDLPGHCPGHWGLALHVMDDRFVFLAADAAWSSGAIRDGIPPPAITTSLLGNTRAYRATLRDLQALSTRETVIIPSHCPAATANSGLTRDD